MTTSWAELREGDRLDYFVLECRGIGEEPDGGVLGMQGSGMK